MTDEELMEQLKSGETDAIDELYARYAKKLYVFCSNTMCSEDASDIVHDVFMRVITMSRSFNAKKASFRTWLFRIALNHCLDIIRRKRKIKFAPVETDYTSIADIADNSIDIESSVIQKSIIEAVRRCIDEIDKEKEKQAILLYYVTGKVYREIGEMLGKSTSMARNFVKSAQDKVKDCLERKGIDSNL